MTERNPWLDIVAAYAMGIVSMLASWLIGGSILAAMFSLIESIIGAEVETALPWVKELGLTGVLIIGIAQAPFVVRAMLPKQPSYLLLWPVVVLAFSAGLSAIAGSPIFTKWFFIAGLVSAVLAGVIRINDRKTVQQ